MRKNQSVPDPDCPECPESVRFWCTTGGWYHEKERQELKSTATMAVAPTAAVLGSVSSLGGLETGGVGQAAPSLTSLVEVMNTAGVASGAAPSAVTPTTKAKAKAKGKAKALPQAPKSEKEKREGART